MLVNGLAYPSQTFTVKSPCGEMFATIVFDLGKTRPIHIILHMGKAGGCAKAMMSTLGDKLSHICAHEKDELRREAIVQMTGVNCHAGDESCIDALAHRLFKMESDLADGILWYKKGGNENEE